jgi:predicted amidophosphoribosyltransferase
MATAELQPQQKCPVCNAASNVGKKYCADCGAPLTSTDIRQVIHAEVTGFMADHLKDRHVVEIELCESVVGRLEKWKKMVWLGGGPSDGSNTRRLNLLRF